MPICIECCYPVPQLYHVLSSRKAPHVSPSSPPNPARSASLATGYASIKITPPTPVKNAAPIRGKNAPSPPPLQASGGGDVRLTQCPRCKRFADKYVEHDYVVLFIDLVLVKPQVGGEIRILDGW